MNIKKLLGGAAVSTLMLGVTAVSVFAASLVSNGSFESGVDPGAFFSTLTPGDTDIDDWTIVSGSVDYIGGLWEASDGDRSIDMTGFSAGTISQDVETVVGVPYKVTFDMAGNPDGAPVVKTMDAMVNTTAPTVESFVFDTTGQTRIDMGWEQREFNFVATDTTTTLSFISTVAGFFGPALDNVSVDQVLPVTGDECKKGGWESFGVFKNQGDCVSFVATGGTNPPAGE